MKTGSEKWVVARFAFAAAAIWTTLEQYAKGWNRPLLNPDLLLTALLVLAAIGFNISLLRRWVRQRRARDVLNVRQTPISQIGHRH